MEQVSPSGPIYQAGTLSGNPLAMVAGYTTLKLLTPEVYKQLEERAARLQAGFERNAQELGIPVTINRVGSMVCPFFTDAPVINFDTAKNSDSDTFRRYFEGLLNNGVSVAPSQFEGMFVSAAHSIEDIDHSIEANYKALKNL